MLSGGVGNRDTTSSGGAGQCVLRHGNRSYTVASASQCMYTDAHAHGSEATAHEGLEHVLRVNLGACCAQDNFDACRGAPQQVDERDKEHLRAAALYFLLLQLREDSKRAHAEMSTGLVEVKLAHEHAVYVHDAGYYHCQSLHADAA